MQKTDLEKDVHARWTAAGTGVGLVRAATKGPFDTLETVPVSDFANGMCVCINRSLLKNTYNAEQ